MLIGFFSTPLLLRWLGDERLAVFKMIEESVAYLGLLELGLSMSLIPIFSKAVGTKDKDVIKSAFKLGAKLYIYTFPLIIVAAVILYFFLPTLYELGSIPKSELAWCYFFLTLTLFFLPSKTSEHYLSASQRKDIANLIYLVRFLTLTPLNLIFAYMGLGLWGQGFSFFVASFFVAALLLYYGRSGSGGLTEITKHQIQESHDLICSWKDRITSTVLNFSLQISIYTDNLIIGLFISPQKIIPFFLTMKIIMSVQTVLFAFSNSVWAGLADFYYKGEHDILKKKVVEVNKVITIAACILFLPVILFNQNFIELWVGAKYYGGDLLTYAGCLFVFLNCLNSFWGVLFLSLGHIQSQAFPSVIGAIINVVTSVIITYYYGIIGPIIGSICSLFFINPYYSIKFLKKELRISYFEQVISIILPSSILLITLPLSFYIKDKFQLQYTWFTLLPLMGVFALLQAFISLPIFLSKEEQVIWIRRIKGILKR